MTVENRSMVLLPVMHSTMDLNRGEVQKCSASLQFGAVEYLVMDLQLAQSQWIAASINEMKLSR